MTRLFLLLTLTALVSCGRNSTEPVTIALNPWPGYEPLHLAYAKGIFDQVDLNVELILMDSLSDAQRAYVHGRVDGLTSTVIEAVQAQVLSSRPLKIVMVPDYSSGGDVIIAGGGIQAVADLKGKKVGCEVSSLGIYILSRALSRAGLDLNDVELVNLEQSDGPRALANGDVDAFVTYPPVSLSILKQPERKIIFTSAEIPLEVIDTVSVSDEALAREPELPQKLLLAWQLALDYIEEYPNEAYSYMASREGISQGEFEAVLADIKILSAVQQQKLFDDPAMLNKRTKEVCEALVSVQSIETNCSALPEMVYQP